MFFAKDIAPVFVGVDSAFHLYPGIWLGQSIPSISNYSFLYAGGTTFNTPSGSTMNFRVNNASLASLTATAFSLVAGTHLASTGTIPTLTLGTNAASATITAGSTDAKGDCVVVATAAPTAATTLISVVYAAAFATAPEVLITAYGPNAASALLYVSARSTTGFTLVSVNAPAASGACSFGYMVLQ